MSTFFRGPGSYFWMQCQPRTTRRPELSHFPFCVPIFASPPPPHRWRPSPSSRLATISRDPRFPTVASIDLDQRLPADALFGKRCSSRPVFGLAGRWPRPRALSETPQPYVVFHMFCSSWFVMHDWVASCTRFRAACGRDFRSPAGTQVGKLLRSRKFRLRLNTFIWYKQFTESSVWLAGRFCRNSRARPASKAV